jgi:hypothetical protein
MTPHQTALSLVEKFTKVTKLFIDGQWVEDRDTAIECAKIAVDEIIVTYDNKNLIYPTEYSYWNVVKQEIEQL